MLFSKDRTFKSTISLSEIKLLAKATNSEMKIEWQGLDDKKALKVTVNAFKKLWIKIIF